MSEKKTSTATNVASSADSGTNSELTKLPKWDPTNAVFQWTAPALHNTAFFRFAAIVGALVAAVYGAGANIQVSAQAASTVHLLSFGTWFGSTVYTTFVGGITMFKNLPRKVFGRLQSKLFPIYFNLSAITILLQIVTLRAMPALSGVKGCMSALGAAMLFTLVNLWGLEPAATKVMFARYELDDKPGAQESEEYKNLQKAFGKYHGMSSLANLIVLCSAVAHGYLISTLLAA